MQGVLCVMLLGRPIASSQRARCQGDEGFLLTGI
jgi:hypothetical protein